MNRCGWSYSYKNDSTPINHTIYLSAKGEHLGDNVNKCREKFGNF